MLIDWFTVAAQIINFLILIWLLKRFLYKPILKAVDAREKLISDQLADAEAGKAAAMHERDEFNRRNAELERNRAALMRQASEEANARRVELLETARQEFEEARVRWLDALQADEDLLTEEISSRARQELFLIVRNILHDLADSDLEAQIITAFIRKLHALGETEKRRLTASFRTTSSAITIRTMYELSVDQQNAVSSAVRDVLETEAPIHFETSPELMSGIEMIVNSRKIHWNISDYVASLEESVEEILISRRRAGTSPESDIGVLRSETGAEGGLDDEDETE